MSINPINVIEILKRKFENFTNTPLVLEIEIDLALKLEGKVL